jgi:multicomponent K+:H+ antiporter subunit D
MTRWIVLPIVLPAIVAPFLVLALRYHIGRQRILSVAATGLLVAITIWLYILASDGMPRPYLLGDWAAPFGIVLVLDRLSATMLLLTSVLAFAVVLYAIAGWDARGRHFHALFHFQLMGINGAFLTGDVFNLFVFFEVMLIASYGLVLHGGGAQRLKAGFHYVAINLIGSTLFLFAVAIIYAVTGTLNMADLAQKVTQIAPGDEALLRTGALLLFLVFALKSALVPLHWWLPGAYAAAPGPVAALFMIMTKVGAYAILRVYTLIFGAEAGAVAQVATPWVIPAALATLALGAAGVLASQTLLGLVCFSVVWSMGSLLVVLGLFDIEGATGGLYYLVHSTFIGASLFLIADLIGERRGQLADRLVPGPLFSRAAPLGAFFLIAAIAITGLPPLSGFLGKLFILNASAGSPLGTWIWAFVLGTSLVVIHGFAQAGSVLFWSGETADGTSREANERGPALPVAVCGFLLGTTALLAAFAGPITREFDATARQVFRPQDYMRAVLPAIEPIALSGR